MRILTMCYEYPPIGGGGSKVVEGLSRELVNQGHEIDLVTMAFGDLPRFEDIDGVHVHRVPCLRASESVCHPYEMVSYIFAALPVVRRLTRQERYDINHTHFIFPDALISDITERVCGLQYIVTAHGSDVPGYNPNRFKILHRFLGPIWKEVVNGAEEIVSPSRSLSTLIAQQKPSTPVTVIPNGINIKAYDHSKKQQNRILVVTRFFERKGIQYFLYALDGMRIPFNVDIVGDGPYLSKLKEIAGSIDTSAEITFHGWMDNKADRFRELFETASIFVFPSEAENFPMVLLEAMMAGCAIITTEGTGCQEVVEETALLVPPRNTGAIRAALELLDDQPELCWNLGHKAHARVEGEFSWPVVAKRYISVYERVVRAGKSEEV
ncbi:MAG: glycosyltransferase family 4 protein [Chloroflexota bacterium]|nr:glycosyltransferase family 4 protein [Chloroflexota bacterium]